MVRLGESLALHLLAWNAFTLMQSNLAEAGNFKRCSQIRFQLNTHFYFPRMSLSHSPALWGVSGVLTEASTIPHTAERKIARLERFQHRKSVTHSSRPILSIKLLYSHPLSLTTVSFSLFSINLSFSFLAVIFLNSFHPFSLFLVLFRSESKRVIGFLAGPTQSLAQEPSSPVSIGFLFSTPLTHSHTFSIAAFILLHFFLFHLLTQ